MKKIIFGLMVSAVACANIQTVEAGKTKRDDFESDKKETVGIAYNGKNQAANDELPENQLNSSDVEAFLTVWVPQAPINRDKSPGLWSYWMSKAAKNPDSIRMIDNSPCFAEKVPLSRKNSVVGKCN